MFHRIGAALYLLWGIVHLGAAVETYRLAAALEFGPAQGKVFQDAWFLLFFAALAAVVAVTLNWKNSATGYWINLVGVSIADIGFIVFMLIPGHTPILPGILGPVLWVLALGFSTLGRMRAN